MWMMGCNDGSGGGGDREFNLPPDSFNNRRLRPLVPRPAPHSLSTPITHGPCLGRNIHGTDFLAFNNHLGVLAEQSKREFNATQQQVVVSSRWNPTPEQLHTLEELFRRGTRTPSADQIQHITAQLRRYGKIEGKNVFYWFQNHKARERQKRRRQNESLPSHDHEQDTERKESGTGASRTSNFEVEQQTNKSFPLPRNRSTLTEKSASIPRGRGTAAAKASDGWVHFDEGEILLQHFDQRRNATWHHLSSSPPNTTTPTTSTTITTSSTTSETVIRTSTMHPKHLKTSQDEHHEEYCEAPDQTLQLFPLRSRGNGDEREKMNPNFAPHQFFEFLPLKN